MEPSCSVRGECPYVGRVRVLVTGATGYVGSRLIPELVLAGHDVVAAVRRPESAQEYPWAEDVEPRCFDVEDPELIASAVDGVDAVVYLIHSMGSDDFVTKDRRAAERMAQACETADVGRVVYLSGLIPDGELSDHLRSRREVEDVFLKGGVPAAVLRAGMVIGSGSTSFEILRRLTVRVPFAPIPSWMRSEVQPVSIEEVVLTISGALAADPVNRHYDIGGEEVCAYPVLLSKVAEAMELRRPQLVLPWAPKPLVGRVVAAITGMDRPTVVALVDSLSHDMVCRENDADRDFLPADYTSPPLAEVFRRSLHDGSQPSTSRQGDVQGGATTDPA